jgi:hypothetical protein
MSAPPAATLPNSASTDGECGTTTVDELRNVIRPRPPSGAEPMLLDQGPQSAFVRPMREPGLRTLEVNWYEQLAAARGHSTASGSPYHVTTAHVESVAAAAIANNRVIMEGRSHWA